MHLKGHPPCLTNVALWERVVPAALPDPGPLLLSLLPRETGVPSSPMTSFKVYVYALACVLSVYIFCVHAEGRTLPLPHRDFPQVLRPAFPPAHLPSSAQRCLKLGLSTPGNRWSCPLPSGGNARASAAVPSLLPSPCSVCRGLCHRPLSPLLPLLCVSVHPGLPICPSHR